MLSSPSHTLRLYLSENVGQFAKPLDSLDRVEPVAWPLPSQVSTAQRNEDVLYTSSGSRTNGPQYSSGKDLLAPLNSYNIMRLNYGSRLLEINLHNRTLCEVKWEL
jgi:hypothetical protein